MLFFIENYKWDAGEPFQRAIIITHWEKFHEKGSASWVPVNNPTLDKGTMTKALNIAKMNIPKTATTFARMTLSPLEVS